MSAAKRDYYEVLGVPRHATQEEIKQAFRRLARQYHPDVSDAPDAEERFKEINEAYAVLSDPERRARYDRFGHQGVEGFGPGGPTPDFVDLMDLFADLFGGFGGRGRRRPRKGRNVQVRVTLTFREAVFGVPRKEITFTREGLCSRCQGSGLEPGTTPQVCPTCHGRGEIRRQVHTLLGPMVQVSTCPTCRGQGSIVRTPCTLCKGRGRVKQSVRLEVDIPPGVDDGYRLRIPGQGEPGSDGGPPGDLYVHIRVKRHPFFRRQGQDILLPLSINVAQAALGAEVEVPTLDGEPARLDIPAGTQEGDELVIPGKGVPDRHGRRGDQRVLIHVEIPRRLTPEQRELFERLAATLGTEVKPHQDRSFWDRLRDWFLQ